MKIYLDTCCYGRPYDDQSQGENGVESLAVMILFFGYLYGACEIIGSEIVEFELSQIPDDIKRGNIQYLYSVVSRRVELNSHIEQRAAALQRYGLKAFDSLHLAAAESVNADVLLTVDKDFIKYAKRASSPVRVENPINFTIQEVKSER